MDKNNLKIRFNFNQQKSTEVILYIINKNGNAFHDLYCLVKIIFEADLYHINNYIRPITGDVFVSMKHGIVPSFTYDLLKNDENAQDFYKVKTDIYANREANLDYLSETDIEAIDYAYNLFKGKSFTSIREYNHQTHKAWEKYYIEGTSTFVPYEELIKNTDFINELQEISSRILI